MNTPKPRFPGQVGQTKVQIVEEEFSDLGVYVWIKENGKAFTDGDNGVLSIEAHKGDEERIKKLKDAASYYGEPNGRPVFYPNVKQVSDAEHSEQVDRMKQGLIPSENDLGALIAAKNAFNEHGSDD
jgi:hypothetical protein